MACMKSNALEPLTVKCDAYFLPTMADNGTDVEDSILLALNLKGHESCLFFQSPDKR